MTENSLILKLNGQSYSRHELRIFAEKAIANSKAEAYELEIYRFILDWIDEKDFIEIKTSGSTGEQKPIKLLKKWMLHSALKTCRYFDFSGSSVFLLCLPASFIAGRMMIVRSIACGANLITVKPDSNPLQQLTTLIDFAALTPFQLHKSIELLKINRNVKTIIAGGAEVSGLLITAIQPLATEIYSTYGMTETCSHIALRKLNGSGKTNCFEIMDGIEIKTDGHGCLVIAEPNLGLINFSTNDMVEIIDSKRFNWIGRRDNLINTGSLKFNPEIWEDRISHLHNSRMIFVPIPHKQLGNAIILVVESENLLKQEILVLKNKIQEITGKHFAPKKIINLFPFPETPTGKPNRMKITAMAAIKKPDF